MARFTIAEAAHAASVDHATLYRYIKSGKLSLTRDKKGKREVDAAEIAMLRDKRDDLRRRLDAAAEERRRLTRLLTDQRATVSVSVEKPGGGLADWRRRLWSG